MPPVTPHLNDDQFAALVSGLELTPEMSGHLSQCVSCQREVAEFRSSIHSFNMASLAWSEAQPAKSLRSVAGSSRPWSISAVPRLSFAAVLVVAVMVSMRVHSDRKEARMLPSAEEDSPALIEQDNRLLLSVDRATSSNVVSPEVEYGFHAVKRADTIRTQGRHLDD